MKTAKNNSEKSARKAKRLLPKSLYFSLPLFFHTQRNSKIAAKKNELGEWLLVRFYSFKVVIHFVNSLFFEGRKMRIGKVVGVFTGCHTFFSQNCMTCHTTNSDFFGGKSE